MEQGIPLFYSWETLLSSQKSKNKILRIQDLVDILLLVIVKKSKEAAQNFQCRHKTAVCRSATVFQLQD